MLSSLPQQLGLAGAMTILQAGTLSAGMLFHLPFDDGTDYTRDNLGSLGGQAEAGFRKGTSHLPSEATAETPPGLGPYAEDFAFLSFHKEVGPALILPSSRDVLQLNQMDDEMTISAWVKWQPGKTPRQTLVSKANLKLETPGGEGWGFFVHRDGRLQFVIMGGVTAHAENTSIQRLEPGRWHHVLVVVRAGDSGSTRYYIDGEETDVAKRRLGTKPAIPSEHPIALAANAPDLQSDRGFTSPLNGALDDVSIWDEVLSDGKIRALAGAPALLPGLQASQLNRLFTLFDQADPAARVEAAGKTWRYQAKLSNPRGEGEVWNENDRSAIQLDPYGAGVETVTVGD